MVAGGLGSGVLGFVAFGVAGAVIADSQADSGNDGFEALGGFVVGAALGTTVMVPLGVHLVNRRQGDCGTALLLSVGIAAAGIGLTSLDGELAVVFLPAIPIGQLIASIAIERATAN
jgi:hypothetical protein